MANVENNLETTIRARIQEIANKLDREFESVLIEFRPKRVFFGQSMSHFRVRFVLKGGMRVYLLFKLRYGWPTFFDLV